MEPQLSTLPAEAMQPDPAEIVGLLPLPSLEAGASRLSSNEQMSVIPAHTHEVTITQLTEQDALSTNRIGIREQHKCHQDCPEHSSPTHVHTKGCCETPDQGDHDHESHHHTPRQHEGHSHDHVHEANHSEDKRAKTQVPHEHDLETEKPEAPHVIHKHNCCGVDCSEHGRAVASTAEASERAHISGANEQNAPLTGLKMKSKPAISGLDRPAQIAQPKLHEHLPVQTYAEDSHRRLQQQAAHDRARTTQPNVLARVPEQVAANPAPAEQTSADMTAYQKAVEAALWQKRQQEANNTAVSTAQPTELSDADRFSPTPILLMPRRPQQAIRPQAEAVISPPLEASDNWKNHELTTALSLESADMLTFMATENADDDMDERLAPAVSTTASVQPGTAEGFDVQIDSIDQSAITYPVAETAMESAAEANLTELDSPFDSPKIANFEAFDSSLATSAEVSKVDSRPDSALSDISIEQLEGVAQLHNQSKPPEFLVRSAPAAAPLEVTAYTLAVEAGSEAANIEKLVEPLVGPTLESVSLPQPPDAETVPNASDGKTKIETADSRAGEQTETRQTTAADIDKAVTVLTETITNRIEFVQAQAAAIGPHRQQEIQKTLAVLGDFQRDRMRIDQGREQPISVAEQQQLIYLLRLLGFEAPDQTLTAFMQRYGGQFADILLNRLMELLSQGRSFESQTWQSLQQQTPAIMPLPQLTTSAGLLGTFAMALLKLKDRFALA